MLAEYVFAMKSNLLVVVQPYILTDIFRICKVWGERWGRWAAAQTCPGDSSPGPPSSLRACAQRRKKQDLLKTA
ncbi:MAG: hypothetical protein IJ418_12695, partial [Clostridia bacterium]|nr:hypothetical protein [Clostridia bacterium]